MNRAYRDYCRLVAASCVSFAPPCGQGSLTPLRLLSPSNQLRWASMGPPISPLTQIFHRTIWAALQRGPRKAGLQALWGEEPQWNGRAFAVGGSEGYGTCGDEIMPDGMAYPY